jgi:opacity protein-like surface antigen
MEIIKKLLYGVLDAMKPRLILTRCLAALAILVGGTSIASATESGWYYALNYGLSAFSSPLTDAIDKVDPDAEGTGFVDDSDASWSFAIGYRVNQYFGFELAFVDLGKQAFGASGPASDLPWELIAPEVNPDDLIGFSADFSGDVHSAGAQLAGLGTFPLGNFEFSGRAGILFAKTRLSSRLFIQEDLDPTNFGEGSFEQTASTIEFMAGVGVGYTFFDHLQVRTDFSYYLDVGDEKKTLETDISTVTVGVAYRF